MRFGIFDHMERRGATLGGLYEERLQMLEFADAAGFYCYHKAEHHFINLDAAPSGTVFLSAAAQRTEQIRLGSLVFLLPFYEPLRLIEEICMLDHLSRGRLEVGVGKGISPAEHTLWGRDPDAARARFEEVFEILRLGLTQPQLDYEGQFYHYENATMALQPQQAPHPGFWYPGNVDYAGRHRLNTIVGGPIPLLAQAAETWRNLVASPDADWNPGISEPTIGATRHMFLDTDEKRAIDRATGAYRKYHDNLSTLFKRYNVDFPPPGDPSFGGDAQTAMAVQGLFAGTPETLVAHVRKLEEVTGINYVIGAFAWGDLTHDETMASMRLFAEEVMPEFQ